MNVWKQDDGWPDPNAPPRPPGMIGLWIIVFTAVLAANLVNYYIVAETVKGQLREVVRERKEQRQ